MRITTAMNHERRMLGHVGEILAWVRLGGHSHSWALEQRRTRVFEDSAWKRVPSWVQRRVNERFGDGLKQMEMVVMHYGSYEHAMAQALARVDPAPAAYVRWQLRVDGEHVTSNQICERCKAGDEDIWNRVEGAHIWNHHTPTRLYSDSWTSCSCKPERRAS